MQSFPMFLRTTDRRVVICGGGEKAAQKARLMLKTDARLLLVAERLDDELAELVRSGRAEHYAGPVTPTLFESAVMGFIATDCPALDAALHWLAQAARCPVNVVDRPDLCDLVTPSIVDRDPVVVAIGTDGTAPVLARQIRAQLEVALPVSLGGLAALAGRLRSSVAARVPHARRRAFWTWVFSGAPRAAWTRGAEREAIASVKAAIAEGGAPTGTQGSIALVGAGPGARDLLTLRAMQRLQEADVVFYDRLVDPEVLDLARRDADRVFVGKVVGAHAWPQERINAVIVAEARKGRRVVRLKSGDPGVFGRAGEELAAARAAGVPVELVPGITAASAAAAALGRSLTERGVADTLVLTTGMSREGDPLPDSVRMAAPGTTMAFYMAVAQAGRIRTALMARGLSGETEVQVAADVSKPDERLSVCPLHRLERHLDETGCTGGAVLLVTWPSQAAARRAAPALAVV
ncbi:siroheme synthase CysG [Seohaeicola zhoushanensis]|nr:siroheme synthase CysG [Seohaeicola zhoushanensis]